MNDIDSRIKKLNKKHFVTQIQGKTVIANEEYDPAIKSNKLTYSSTTDLRNKYASKEIQYNGELVNPAETWLKHPGRREFEGVTFNPDPHYSDPAFYNLWKGYEYEETTYDPENPDILVDKFSLFYWHINEVIAGGDKNIANYIFSWMACAVQNPHERKAFH